MGLCSSCIKGSSAEYTTPDMETRRRQQVEAAQRRQQEQETRGIKDPERIKRMQIRSEELSKLEQNTPHYSQDTGLKWQVS